MWEATSNDTNICTVQTLSGQPCLFPFTYNGQKYYSCIITGPSNPSFIPQCMVSSSKWSFCKVPTDAVINYVTTRKGGSSSQNGASTNGGTLVYIYGYRFAQKLCTMMPTKETTNKVFLESNTASYECEMEDEKSSTTQLTCRTYSPMIEDTYTVRIYVNRQLIPLYQYIKQSQATVKVNSASTPKITSIYPSKGVPESLIGINGSFNTNCYKADDDGCGDDGIPRISRVYIGSQQCEMYDEDKNELRGNITKTSLACKLEGNGIGNYNVSLLVSEDNGRSTASGTTYYVSADESIYNFQSFAEITSVTPNIFSTEGSGRVTIKGKYLYHDENTPSRIKIGESDCEVIEFDNSDNLNSKIVCETKFSCAQKNSYFGNRGINLHRDNVFTSFTALGTTSPTKNAQKILLDSASYVDTNLTSVTVWFTGFFSPNKTSNYTLSLKTNGVAKLFLSTDDSPSNKVLVASTSSSPLTKPLIGGRLYYFEAIASRSNGQLTLDVNAKMLQTNLNSKICSQVKTEVQDIEITSKILPESKLISYSGLKSGPGVEEVQTLKLIQRGANDFILNFDGANTSRIPFGASALTVQKELNDLPTLDTEGVTVTTQTLANGDILYIVKFTANRGDVPEITEKTQKVGFSNTETVKGVPTLSKFQVNVNDAWSNLFDIENDTVANIQSSIEEIFKIRCPLSIQKKIASTTFAVFDFETECQFDDSDLSITTFCGKCARKNSNTLVSNINSPMSFNQLCFAYKLTSPVTQISLTLMIDGDVTNQKNAYISVITIADKQWHYMCVDMYEGILKNWATTSDIYQNYRLTLISAWLGPVVSDMYIDVVSIRNSIPSNIDDASLLSRRVFPQTQMIYNTLSVIKNTIDKTLQWTFRPNKCISLLIPSIARQNKFNVLKSSTISSASTAVEGTFDLEYDSEFISGIPANASDNTVKNLLQSIKGIGPLNVIRSKDCTGYKWSIQWGNGGKQKQITIKSTTLRGNTVNISAKSTVEGGIEFFPIQGDLLKTFHTTPQISVHINGILSKCSANCSFECSSDYTPAVDLIDKSDPELIKITGSGFDEIDINNNEVKIGETQCVIVSATSTTIFCKPEMGPAGTYTFKVKVIPKGLAKINTIENYFTYNLTIDSYTTVTAGTGGGNFINITGKCFSERSIVRIDGQICQIKNYTRTSITIVVPSNPTTSNKTVDLEIEDGDQIAKAINIIKYDNTNTPTVETVTPSILHVFGGQIIEINGTNFNISIKKVFFGEHEVIVKSYTETQIIIESSVLQPGIYDLIIPSGEIGNAKTSIKIEYKLYISSITPNIGSIRGGCLITIYGEGFSKNKSLNDVSLGVNKCNVVDCTDKWIRCKTNPTNKIHYIDNSATDQYFGKGYAWNITYLTINKGDYVNWSWKAPGAINGINYKIEQVSDPLSETGSGFSSGIPSSSGSYIYQFNKEGIYHYWSGYVDLSGRISFRGVINVIEATDYDYEIDVTVNGFKAQKCSFPFLYKSVNYTSCIDMDLGYSWCSPQKNYNDQSLQCTPLDNPEDNCPSSQTNIVGCLNSNTQSPYKYKFTSCNIAIINSISPLNGSADDLITITGSGFSTNDCENKVLIGDYECQIISSSVNELVCKIDKNSNLNPSIIHNIEVQIKSFGYALQYDSYTFKFIPKVFSISPNIGSISGGSKIEIRGDGFTNDTILKFAGYTYTVFNFTEISYDKIVFITNESSPGISICEFYINDIQYKVESNESISFEYSTIIAPTIISIEPTSVTGAETININGTNFGTDLTKLKVKIGNEECIVSDASDTAIICSIKGLSVGSQSVVVNVKDIGNSLPSSITCTGKPSINSISPNTGSIFGGTKIKISGNGFSNIKNTQVKIGTKLCTLISVTTTEIICNTPDNPSGSVSVTITSNGQTFPSSSFNYDSSLTPSINQISPTSGSDGQTITIFGSGFGLSQSDVSVKIGSANCEIQSISNNQIECITKTHCAGSYNVELIVNPYGYANKNILFNYELIVTSVSSLQGSYGGGLEINFSGAGFDGLNTLITICNNKCLISNSKNSSEVSCKVPAMTYSNTDTTCPLIINVNGTSISKIFTYVNNISSTISSVSPLKGGTGGGTLITISGNNLPIDKTKIKVTIAGSECLIESVSETTIICYTGYYTQSSITAPILVFIEQSGFASQLNPVNFKYIDLWSSKYTWGGVTVPQEGELVVIDVGQTIYFDAVTPVLKGLIIQGGSLIFDDNQDVHLNAEYIIITDNGTLQIGTESNPFQHNATITMWGTLRSIELPIYGAKVLALRNGTLDIHGKPSGVTWTYLSVTAENQTNQIQLIEAVKWNIGVKIVIATTGDKFSQGESEVRTVVDISEDGKTLTLDAPLNFEHLAVKRTTGDTNVYIRAEVGLLTRNVVFNSINDDSWNSLRSANACPNGFNPGEYATMTCYLGRYGKELGSDEFGATIMINNPKPNKIGSENVIARISNVEIYHVGQAFRLDRYAINFNMIGDSPSSYVKECAIYESFNRAVNLKATNYVNVERNVIYNIMGSALFLQDGIEIGNKFQYNLAIFVKTSSSLLNTDITPAAFFANNPNNTWQHNSVAGCSHFGFWFRFLDRSDGASYNSNYCPKKIPFGKFFNNTAHSNGRFGLWIYPGYTPTVSGGCNDRNALPAKFESFISYKNDKGAEWVMGSNIQFRNFIVYDQFTSGIETKSLYYHSDVNTEFSKYFFNETSGPIVSDCVIIGNSDSSFNKAVNTQKGLVIPWDRGVLYKNIKFINFFDNGYAIGAPTLLDTSGVLVYGSGGWTVHFTGLVFINVKYRTLHRWTWDSIMYDIDGSLSGLPGNVVVSASNITRGDNRCQLVDAYFNGIVCSNTLDWIRFTFNNVNPNLPVNVFLRNSKNDTDVAPKLKTNPGSFVIAIEANQTYELEFEYAPYPSNISYTGTFFNLKSKEYLIIKHKMNAKPDQVIVYNSVANESFFPLSMGKNGNGDWYWENDTRTLSYIIHNKEGRLPFLDGILYFSAKKCRYANCLMVPYQPALALPVTTQPTTVFYWSQEITWKFASFIRVNESSSLIPADYDIVKIPSGIWVIVDISLPRLTRIQIDGVLEFQDTIDNKLSVNEIFINGGQLIIGWENNPFTHNVEIELMGTRSSTEYILPNGYNSFGTKAIGVYGGLDLHGLPRKPAWTRLAKTASAGNNTLTLIEIVDWKIGEEIIISTTSHNPFETEIFKIIDVSVDKKTITLDRNLLYDHIATSEKFQNGKSYSISAGVGLLTRNIKITGGEYANQFNELFGSRIIVSDYSNVIYSDGVPATVYYKGYARISDVEFKNFGQFSRYAQDDYKYGILFSNLGTYNPLRPSYVNNSAFHNGFSGAIGVINSAGIPIVNNTLYRTIDFGVKLEGNNNILRKNMILLNIWSPTFVTYAAAFENRFWAAIDIRSAASAVVEDNLIAGSQRIGINYRGSPCPGKSLSVGLTHSIKRNSIYGSITGVAIFPKNTFNLNCIYISDFIIYKSIHVGIYYQTPYNVIVDSNVLIDNQINIFTQIYSPRSTSHYFNKDRSANVTNNLIVGRSPSYDCVKDKAPLDLNNKYALKAYSYGAANGGKIGVIWANFMDGSNGAPFRSWLDIGTYNYINGLLTLDKNTFAHFKTSCNGSVDAVITSSKYNDNGQMPVVIKNTNLYDVENESKVYLHRPNINKINPSACVDMDCDGNKKNLLTDIDGSFLGTPGHVISQSEYGWGDQARGLGDFRIPRLALADQYGHMKNISSVYTYPGIVRDEKLCVYKDSWQAYECHGLDYKILVIESMDNDTEIRRLSPVAILSDNKYLDLINGPQNHGFCRGYACQKRVSTFLAIIAANKHYDIFLSSTPPNKLRFRVIQATQSFKATLSMSYTTSNRIDVYKNVKLVDATNADRSSGSLILKDPQNNLTQYMPNFNSVPGTNFMDRKQQKLYFSIDGSDYIDLVISQEIFLTFGVKATTADAFFDSNTLVFNIATLLGVPPSMIRRVEIVSALGNNLRLVKRQDVVDISGIKVILSTDPVDSIDNIVQITNNNDLILNTTADIATKYYFGQFRQAANQMNLNVENLTVEVNQTLTELREIGKLILTQDISNCRAQSPCDKQPILSLVDKNNQPVNIVQFGNQLTVLATVYQGSATILNQYEVYFDADGSARFTTLGFSDETKNLIIKFTLQISSNPTVFIILSSSVDVTAPIYSIAHEEIDTNVTVGDNFQSSFYLIDAVSKMEIKNPGYKGQTFTACVKIYENILWQPLNAKLKTQNPCVSLNTSINRFVYSNLSINQSGMYILEIEAISNDDVYSINATSNNIRITSVNYTDNEDCYYNLEMKLNGTFISDNRAKYISMIYNYFLTNYNAELNGPIDCYSDNGIMFVSGFECKNETLLSQVSNGTVNETREIIEGSSLLWFILDNFSFEAPKVSTLISLSSPTATDTTGSTIGIVVGAICGIAVIVLIIVASVLISKKLKAKKPTDPRLKRKVSDAHFINKPIKKAWDKSQIIDPNNPVRIRASSIASMSRLNSVRTPDQLFNSDRELTNASISAVRIDEEIYNN